MSAAVPFVTFFAFMLWTGTTLLSCQFHDAVSNSGYVAMQTL